MNGAHDFLVGSGEMARLIRSTDWSKTPLGPPETWPQSLRSAVSILLPSKAQITLFWGPEFVSIYNDAYRPVLGAKHPRALGLPGREVWKEIWETGLRDLFEGVLRTGDAFWAKDRLFFLERHGYAEETFFDVSYDPVRDESGGVGGLFCIVSETTGRVLGERRLRTLRDLAERSTKARNLGEACSICIESMSQSAHDLVFVLLFLQEREGEALKLQAATAGATQVGSPSRWPLAEVLRAHETRLVDLDASFGELPVGAWSRPPLQAAVVPLTASSASSPRGALVVGLNPFRPFDDEYQGFLELLSRQVSAALGSAHAHEEERRRAESLAELDRAKTAFFSNVSHEFRTPLTLLLGPIRELMEKTATPGDRELLGVAERNGQRLLKLVNTLLEFSRIEAGRTQASYVPTDLARLTAELASSFRSAIEKAGLRLVVDCERLSEPVYVDRDMWERIVLNLLSNALKFTFEGEIAVRMRCEGQQVELVVEDTGTGIPKGEMPHLFERFWRLQGAKSRTHEGTGIGLALVQELVKLHGGTVSAQSAEGEGSTFRVRVPLGTAHLPKERLGAASSVESTALGAIPYVQEALRWLPDDVAPTTDFDLAPRHHAEADARRRRIVWADDNADMREYVCRLLGPLYEVEAVNDGKKALDVVRARRPDLVLADVMMPELDGLGLVRALRADPETASLPVILISARAGEEPRIEGLGAGADEYLYKPFSARELLARVASRLENARLHRQREQLIEKLREADQRKDEFLATLAHELRNPLAPLRNALHLLLVSGGTGARTERLREIIERQVNHLVRLVDDLLEMSRINRGALDMRSEHVELAAIVKSAVETSEPLIVRARHELSVSLPTEPVWLDGDPVRIAQLLSNLLNNAAQYTESGGRIALEARVEGGGVEIAVRDNGAGIAPEALERIFEMFSRGDRASRRNQGGLGIGLSLSRRLAEMHGGSLSVKSEGIGKGSEFLVRLPVSSGELAKSEVARDEKEQRLLVRRILVVDDNQDSLESLGALLGFLGADVRTAADGPAALEVFADYDPAMVFLDIGMPGMDGYEVARRIREGFPERHAILVALTGWGQSDDRRRAREAGFDHHLVKPADFAALQALLSTNAAQSP